MKKITPHTNIIQIVQNMIMRGSPTIASAYLRKELNLERDYLNNLEELRFLSKENLNWTQTIKGDVENDDYPADQFYNDLEHRLDSYGFIRNLIIAECPISWILPEVNQAFIKQQVDFYIPLLKTIFEVDGIHHKEQKEFDAKRDKAFERFGVKVIRINTKEIRAKNYNQFKLELKEILKIHKGKVDLYRTYLDMNRDMYDVQIKLTSIVRFQIFVLELVDRGVLSLESKNWKFNVFALDAKLYLELALKDLELWIANIAALFNLYIDMPHIKINVYEDESHLPRHHGAITIKFDIFKRWDDSINEPNVYHIRTDFDDDANYFSVKVNEPVIYALNVHHQKHLEFLLDNLFGYDSFREGQLEIIMNCLNGEDTVGLLPTGGGKSLTYQICVMLQPAISFVVVPIKALMLDQFNNLTAKHHITHTSYINSDLLSSESTKRLRDFAAGKYFFLIISPERFQSRNFREEIALVNRTKALAVAVIDEVHCLSEWGHEFRTSYLALANTIRNFAPSARFLALTATASSKVLKDVMIELNIESSNVITISNFTRPELNFNIVKVNRTNKKEILIELLNNAIKKSSSNHHKKSAALVFTPNVGGSDGCYQIHHYVHDVTGLTTGFYSGSRPKKWDSQSAFGSFSTYKDHIQQAFMRDEIDVLVATKAFGMGIDKGNIRLAMHYGLPGSLESFYQEAGRAGRDKKESKCIVLYSPDRLNETQLQTVFGMNTNLSTLQSEMKKMNGDLGSLLYFLTMNLLDVEVEVDEIYTFHQLFCKDGNHEFLVGFTDQDLGRTEKCVYRLALLGIIEDWTVNWKNQKLEIVYADWTEESVIEKLTKHIQKYDYTFTLNRTEQNSELYPELIDHFDNSDEPFLKKMLYVLLKWYNDNVIYSRKRSMLLMKQYADEFTDNDTLQQKIEIYFKRNNDVYVLENIVGLRDKMKDWFKIFYVQEEGKDDKPRAISTFKSLKITVSRFLESYKNDIALNIINGLLSLAAGEFDNIDERERLSSAIREIVRLGHNDRQEMLQSILATSDQYLSISQGNQLSEVLISNGFIQMDELRQIFSTFEDDFSYGYMLKVLNFKIKDQSKGGYPWEA